MIQSFRRFEVIVVTKSDSSNVIMLHNLPAFVRFVKEEGSSLYAAMNQGIVEARGECCLFLNSGDELFCVESLANLPQASDKRDWSYLG